MFNLLPQEKKAKIESEYKARRVLLYMVCLSIIVFIVLVLMFPSYLLSKVREDDLQSSLNSFSVSKSTTTDSDEGMLSQVKDLVGVLKEKPDPYSYDLFMKVIENKKPEIRFRGISYTNKVGEGIKISLVGSAKTRDSLILFQKSLEKEKIFSKVDFPLSLFAKDKDIDFSITLGVTPL